MNVTFVLPGGARYPTGGARMVFRYANALAQRGTRVALVMPSDLSPAPLMKRMLRAGRYAAWALTKHYAPKHWFSLHPAVQLLWRPSLLQSWAPDGDAVVATSVRTAEMVATWPARSGRKFYLVQGYETWDFPKERVEASWRLPLEKLSVSSWLCGLVEDAGEKAHLLRNSVDESAFGLDHPLEARNPASLLWPHNALRQKGSADVCTAFVKLQSQQALAWNAAAFGTVKAPIDWPTGVGYHRNPAQTELRRLYNSRAIFIAPSHSEGWGLPACEALQCGCAVVASDIGGHREFLRHEENALLYPPGDIDAMVRSVLRLCGDLELRLRIAQRGNADMQALTIEPMVSKLDSILRDTLKTDGSRA